MSRAQALIYTAILAVMGAGWGLTQPLSKIAVSTGYQHFGLIFWQLVITAGLLAVVSLLRGSGLPLRPEALRVYVMIALIGTLIPNSASYQSIAHLPSGVVSILLSLVPVMAFPIALGLGLERAQPRRFLGLMAGLGGVLLLVLPEASLPDRAVLIWIPVSLLTVLCYAFEGNYVARWGTAGLDPIEVIFGASVIGMGMVLPLALGSGQFINPLVPWGAAEWALIGSSVIHGVVYTSYVWLVGRAGPVFASQVGYLVTGFGVVWAMLILSESYEPSVWVALGLIFAGVLLVQPRRTETEVLAPEVLAQGQPIGESEPRHK